MRGLVLGFVAVALVGACVGAQTLSGTWESTISFDPTQGTLADAFDFGTELTVNYEVGGWTFTSFTEFDDTGWADQKFSAGGVVGSFTFSSTADFAPAGDFEGLDVATGIALGGMSFDIDFDWFDQDVELTVPVLLPPFTQQFDGRG